MNPAFFVLVSLVLTSLTLALILVAAWRMFDRPPHAATWAAAFTVSAVQWFLNLLASIYYPDSYVGSLLFATLSAIVATLLAIGFRQRAGLGSGRVALFAGAAITILLIGWALSARPGSPFGFAPLLLFWTLLLLLSAETMLRRTGRPDAAARGAIAVRGGFGGYTFVGAALAASHFNGDVAAQTRLYRAFIILGTPAGFNAVGLSAIFLIAADLADRMRALATADPLTGILNRRGLAKAAAIAIANCQRQKQPVAVVIADLDRFKTINDAFGHAAGDAALQLFARHVTRALRVGDPIGRIGGEEFAFLLINTLPAAALEVVERIRSSMSMLVVDGADDARMTASFGIAVVRPGETMLDEILVRADAALYQAKLAGRNRVMLAEG